jgi:hypothetical protein
MSNQAHEVLSRSQSIAFDVKVQDWRRKLGLGKYCRALDGPMFE